MLMMLCRLAAVLAITIAQLAGTWTSTEKEVEDDSTMDMTENLVLGQDGSFTHDGYCFVSFILDAEEGIVFEGDFVFSSKGTWTVEDDILVLKYDPKSASVTGGDKKMPGVFNAFFIKPLMNEFKKEMKKPAKDRIISLTANELRVISTIDKNPEEQVYHKK